MDNTDKREDSLAGDNFRANSDDISPRNVNGMASCSSSKTSKLTPVSEFDDIDDIDENINVEVGYDRSDIVASNISFSECFDSMSDLDGNHEFSPSEQLYERNIRAEVDFDHGCSKTSDNHSTSNNTDIHPGTDYENSATSKQSHILPNPDLHPCSGCDLETTASQDSTRFDSFDHCHHPDVETGLDIDSMSISSLETMGTTSLLSRLMEQTHFHRFDRLSEDEEEIVSTTHIDSNGDMVNSYCNCNHAKSIWCSRHQDFMDAITKIYRNEKSKLPSASVPVVAGLIAARDYGQSPDLACPQCVCSLRSYNINNTVGDKQEQLLDAIRHHDVRIVKDLLVNWNLNPNYKLNKKNPICKAVCMGNTEIINLLIDAGADLDTSNQADMMWDRKPVHIAACRGDFASLELLVQRGADINHRDSDERTPLHWVAMYGHSHLISWMLKSGADTTAAQSDGFTALHTATCLGHAAVCRELLSGGALLSVADIEGWTPLHTSVCYGNIGVIRLLLYQPDCPVSAVTSSGDSILHIACSKGRVDIIDLVLQQGVSLETCNRQGATALHTAVLCRRVHATLCLIRCGANVNAVDNQGVCPAYMAAIRGEVEILRLLVSAGCYLPHGIHRLLRKHLPTHLTESDPPHLQPPQNSTRHQPQPPYHLLPHLPPSHPLIEQPPTDQATNPSPYQSTHQYTYTVLVSCVEHLQRSEGQPLNLTSQCLHTIRRSLSPRLHLTTHQLPVPPSVQRAIAMETLSFVQSDQGKRGELMVVSMDSERLEDREEFLNQLTARRVGVIVCR